MSQRVRVVAATFLMLGATTAHAQTYPAKPVRFIVPFAAGGSADIVARIIAPKLGEQLGQTIVIDNRPGASAIIGVEAGAKAPPDGYTVTLGGFSSHVINAFLFPKLPYDPVRDFVAITVLTRIPNLLSAHPSVPVKTMRELIALAKAHPGELSYASAGMGNSTHLAGELFGMLAGVRMVHIPYKGSGPAMADTLGGQTAATFDSMQASMPHIKTNRLRPLAITAARRSPVIPDLPTIAEAGVPGAEAGTWYGMLAPASTPRAIVVKLNAEVIRALALPDVRDRLAAVGVDPIGSTPEQFAEEIKSDIVKWGKTIRVANVRAD